MTMRTPETTREAVLAAMAECDRLGESAFLAEHGFGPSAVYRLWYGQRDYPSKAILGVAAGMTAREFSGGAAHTARVLARLGFEVRKVAQGRIARVLALVAGIALSWPYRAPAVPADLPLDPVCAFASGANRPGEIRAFAELGHDIGVAAPEVSPTAERQLAELAGTDVQVFCDSGAFSEVEFGPGGARVVSPIDDAAWRVRLALYHRLARALGEQLHVVAPDRVGDQAETLARLERYAPEMRAIAALGARVLVPVQKGALPQAEFWERARAVLGIADAVPALPCKKAATSARELHAFVRATRPARVHLLGMGLRGPRARDYLAAVALGSPATHVSVDSNVMVAHIGQTGGKAGGPRRVTLARRWGERLLSAGRLARSALTEFAVLLAMGGSELGQGHSHNPDDARIAGGQPCRIQQLQLV